MSYDFSADRLNKNYNNFLIFYYIFHFFWVALENNISEHSWSLYLHKSKNRKQSTTLLNPAAKKLFHIKVFVKTIKKFIQKKKKNYNWKVRKISWTARLGNCKISRFTLWCSGYHYTSVSCWKFMMLRISVYGPSWK